MRKSTFSLASRPKSSFQSRSFQWRQGVHILMGMSLLLLLVCAACSPLQEGDAPVARAAEPIYGTQTNVPAPDYRVLLGQPSLADGGGTIRPATASLPLDAKAIGDLWIARVQERGALLGSGLAGKGSDGPVVMIDTGFTAADFESWTSENHWTVPKHIRWSFVAPMKLPSVSAAAKPLIRLWPAATARTGLQNAALLRGRLELRDGCIFAGDFGNPADKLAWFHTEVGLDVDAAGYLILRNRISGQTLARLGEDVVWSGPASAAIDSQTTAALQQACGPADILIVGSPESAARFQARYPRS